MPPSSVAERGVMPSPKQPRAYQIEMFEESMRRNVIVAMDTGSGKTQIAALRIEAELHRSPHKLVWFITPTAILAEQQHDYLAPQLAAYQFRTLTGSDNVDHWSSKAIWDAVLSDINVVISTPQVLLDALTHAFVRMDQLSLLVCDEAHHCMKRNALNRIMQIFYHPFKLEGAKLPHILGLSASPMISSNPQTVQTLEQNLDAICKCPTRHVAELMSYSHRPDLLRIPFEPSSVPVSVAIQQLQQLVDDYDISEDPFVRSLAGDERPAKRAELCKALQTKSTRCYEQLKALLRRATLLHEDLGGWIANEFLALCTAEFATDNSLSGEFVITLDVEERKHLNSLLSGVRSSAHILASVDHSCCEPSAKFAALVDLLVREHTSNVTAVIFVEQRITTWALCRMITLQESLKHKYVAAPFVGFSSNTQRKVDLVDLTDLKAQKTALYNVRSGSCNLCVATSVLEEGVDITAMNLVVRFDAPQTFRSFIQSRGRARQPNSKFAMLANDADVAYGEWKRLEAEMKALYEDEMRQLAARIELEDGEEASNQTFRVASTGATLKFDSAIPHLEHFCASLPKVPFTDLPRPEFILLSMPDKSITATVILPSSLAQEFRSISTTSFWQTEKAAKRDAAFHAYMKLYEAGLVNKHLLPTILPESEEQNSFSRTYRLDGTIPACSRIKPWREIAARRQTSGVFYAYELQVQTKEECLSLLLYLPKDYDLSIEASLYWNKYTTHSARVKRCTGILQGSDAFSAASQITEYLMTSMFRRKMQARNQSTFEAPFLILPRESLQNPRRWLENCTGSTLIEKSCTGWKLPSQPSLIRQKDKLQLYLFEPQEAQPEESDNNGNLNLGLIELKRLPKRVDFLRRMTSEAAHTAKDPAPIMDCCVDKLPVAHGRMMLFIPSILHVVEVAMVAHEAMANLLAPINFCDRNLVMAAISAPSALEQTNYERLEFLGDSLLKYYASVQLFAQYPRWDEGRLTGGKGQLVSNAVLCHAALRVGLDRYIHTDPFTGTQWKPPSIEEVLKEIDDGAMRTVSSKTIADVVEALLGAAWLDGGRPNSGDTEDKVLACLRLFLSEVPWQAIPRNMSSIKKPAGLSEISAGLHKRVEAVVDHEFTNQYLILEAFTHPSQLAIRGVGSYQRLEFLGDAVLDRIVVGRLFEAQPPLDPERLTLMRHAVVNGHLLGFLCLGRSHERQVRDALTNHTTLDTTIEARVEKKYLWQYLRYSSPSLTQARDLCFERYQALRGEIGVALSSGKKYPWVLLTKLRPEKFFSDVVESVLGAIFVDSCGSLDACAGFLAKIGLTGFLERLVCQATEIDVLHPKARLGILSGNARLEYQTVATAGSETRRYACTVLMDGEIFGEVQDGLSREEVETRAADDAVEALLERKSKSLDRC